MYAYFNLLKDIRDEIFLIEFTSFQQLCAVLHHYQLQVSQFKSTTPMTHVPVDKCDVALNPNKFLDVVYFIVGILLSTILHLLVVVSHPH